VELLVEARLLCTASVPFTSLVGEALGRGRLLGADSSVHPARRRSGCARAEVGDGERADVLTSEERMQITKLRHEGFEWRRASESLRVCLSVFEKELD
jgi:hypothetical protein